jgi:hypothetical protein
MPMYAEYDKITGDVRRILSADDLPADVAHLSYVEIPPETPEVDLSKGVDAIRKMVEKKTPSDVNTPSSTERSKPPLIEEV